MVNSPEESTLHRVKLQPGPKDRRDKSTRGWSLSWQFTLRRQDTPPNTYHNTHIVPYHYIPCHTMPYRGREVLHSLEHYLTVLYPTPPSHIKPHHATPHHITLRHTTPHHTTQHHTTQNHTTPYLTPPRHITSHHTTPHHTTPHHTTTHHTAPHHTTPHHTAPHHTLQYFAYLYPWTSRREDFHCWSVAIVVRNYFQ